VNNGVHNDNQKNSMKRTRQNDSLIGCLIDKDCYAHLYAGGKCQNKTFAAYLAAMVLPKKV
jgi:hypothetical protein